jgi:hypothetical protein
MSDVSKSTSSALRAARLAFPAHWCWYADHARSPIWRSTPAATITVSSVTARSMRSPSSLAAQ